MCPVAGLENRCLGAEQPEVTSRRPLLGSQRLRQSLAQSRGSVNIGPGKNVDPVLLDVPNVQGSPEMWTLIQILNISTQLKNIFLSTM